MKGRVNIALEVFRSAMYARALSRKEAGCQLNTSNCALLVSSYLSMLIDSNSLGLKRGKQKTEIHPCVSTDRRFEFMFGLWI